MQYTVAECTDALPDVSAYKENRDLLFGALTDYGYEAVPPDGAFYLFVKSPEPDAESHFAKGQKNTSCCLCRRTISGARGMLEYPTA